MTMLHKQKLMRVASKEYSFNSEHKQRGQGEANYHREITDSRLEDAKTRTFGKPLAHIDRFDKESTRGLRHGFAHTGLAKTHGKGAVRRGLSREFHDQNLKDAAVIGGAAGITGYGIRAIPRSSRIARHIGPAEGVGYQLGREGRGAIVGAGLAVGGYEAYKHRHEIASAASHTNDKFKAATSNIAGKFRKPQGQYTTYSKHTSRGKTLKVRRVGRNKRRH